MTSSNLTFLQIGLGSMGKRRIRNLLRCGVDAAAIHGFDPDPKKRQEAHEHYGIKVYGDFAEADRAVAPDVYIISTPPNLHHEYFLHAARAQKHFFVEAATVDTGYAELLPLLNGSFVAAPSCTFRYFPAVKKMKDMLAHGAIGRVLCFTYHLGQYLPDWHPWEDYRQVYFAKKETGGGREMFPFELIWLTDLMSAPVEQVAGMVDKLSDLDMEADDIYAAVLRFSNRVMGTMLIDVLSRAPFRTLRLIGAEGVLEWEWLQYSIRIYRADKKEWETIALPAGNKEQGYITTEDMYEEEVAAFRDAIAGKRPYPYSFAEDWRILKTLFALEESWKSKKIITVC